MDRLPAVMLKLSSNNNNNNIKRLRVKAKQRSKVNANHLEKNQNKTRCQFSREKRGKQWKVRQRTMTRWQNQLATNRTSGETKQFRALTPSLSPFRSTVWTVPPSGPHSTGSRWHRPTPRPRLRSYPGRPQSSGVHCPVAACEDCRWRWSCPTFAVPNTILPWFYCHPIRVPVKGAHRSTSIIR